MSKERKNMQSKYRLMQTTGYKKRKHQSMIKMKSMRQKKPIKSGRDFIVLANGVSGKGRIDSRIRVITKGCKGTDDNV